MKKTITILITAILLTLTITPAFAEDVTVTIPEFDVTVNGTTIDTEHSQYPVITYKGVTYFPMTSDYLSGIGLGLDFSSTTGLKINVKDEIGTLQQNFLGASNKLGSVHKAQLAPFALEVNNKTINNNQEEYPVLLFKNITYFPMTWKFAVEEFGWETAWSDAVGFGISTNGTIIIPVPVIKESNDSTFKFRNVVWGSTISSVKSNEGVADSESSDYLWYEDIKIAGLDADLIFLFTNGYLSSAGYTIKDNYLNDTNHISDYNNLKKILTDKYGRPSFDETVWYDDLWKDDYNDWGMALKTSDLVYMASWKIGTTNIIIKLGGDNYDIDFAIGYYDTNVEVKDNTEGL